MKVKILCILWVFKVVILWYFLKLLGAIQRKSLHIVQLFWDKHYPLISYIETLVMTFTEYLCYCGGLFGIWFGTNANQVLNFVANIENWIFLKEKLKLLSIFLLELIIRSINSLLNLFTRIYLRINEHFHSF